MKKPALLVCAFTALVFSGWFAAVPFNDFASFQFTPGGGAKVPSNIMSQTKSPTQRFLDALPDGQTVKYTDFCNNVNSPLTNFLGWSNPQDLTRTGKHVVVTLPQAASKTDGSVTINLKQTIEFDVDLNAVDLTLTDIKGVSASVALLPAFPLKEAILAEDGSGNTEVTAKIQVSWILPYRVIKIKLDQNGNQVP